MDENEYFTVIKRKIWILQLSIAILMKIMLSRKKIGIDTWLSLSIATSQMAAQSSAAKFSYTGGDQF